MSVRCQRLDRMARMDLLLCFLLLCAGLDFSWSVLFQTLVVSQSPDVSVLEGETVKITCCWNKTAERVGLKWLKNQTTIQDKTFMNQLEGSWTEQKNKCVVLMIEKIKRSDSGRYICKVFVEIPVLAEVKGDGTTITVTARGNPPDSTDHHTDEERIDGVVEDKGDVNSNTQIVDETLPVHLEDKENTVKHKGKTTERMMNHIANDKKKTIRKWGGNAGDNANPRTADGMSVGSQEEMFTFVLRCLPILALITAFFWLYYIGTKAQQNKAAVLGNKASSEQKIEEDQKEKKKEECVTKEKEEEEEKEKSI
ncbi:uncharacterized protein LOC124881080 isoform X3 [Girardinichthys multiradiatus]|uniref:uncharacterized protein LOC124881080 isoform X3 n=1 Tax=Girardinichthys multiradiatus TaxID=208333 RepID=UPI001FABB60B|nr:uncharacterized protein LOC124881080 isoform X3 [Girardinichthys multiradiatus]